MDFLEAVQASYKKGALTPSLKTTLEEFYPTYKEAIESQGHSIASYSALLLQFINFVEEQLASPYQFKPFHQAVKTPVDYYQFGLDFLRPLVIFSESKVLGKENVQKAAKQVKAKENAIFFANHQTEPDPQAISLLLEKEFPDFARNMIFVAGHRVTTDPLAVPFSMGRNLLCIFSKKHIDANPKTKEEKLLHNQRTMQVMGNLLAEGGKSIYVAPSGGRDRPSPDGSIQVSPFDPASVEMFRLIAKSSQSQTHYYPLSLATYSLLPPPNSVEKALGEKRHTKATAIHLACGKEVDLEAIPGTDGLHKKEIRKKRAEHLYHIVCDNYETLLKLHGTLDNL